MAMANGNGNVGDERDWYTVLCACFVRCTAQLSGSFLRKQVTVIFRTSLQDGCKRDFTRRSIRPDFTS